LWLPSFSRFLSKTVLNPEKAEDSNHMDPRMKMMEQNGANTCDKNRSKPTATSKKG
jgi:hypothetical protein